MIKNSSQIAKYLTVYRMQKNIKTIFNLVKELFVNKLLQGYFLITYHS